MSREQDAWEEERRVARLDEQEQDSDYTPDMEKCECGAYINSDNRCPSCDY